MNNNNINEIMRILNEEREILREASKKELEAYQNGDYSDFDKLTTEACLKLKQLGNELNKYI